MPIELWNLILLNLTYLNKGNDPAGDNIIRPHIFPPIRGHHSVKMVILE